MKPSGSNALRRCVRCGARLSRYGTDEVCSACVRQTARPVAAEPVMHDSGWLSQRSLEAVADDAGAVLRAWRVLTGQNQAAVASLLGMTQQNLSQIESGKHALSLEQRRRAVVELGIPAEELGLTSGQVSRHVARDEASPQIAASRLRWRTQRRWLNQHRSMLARLAAQLYPEQHRVLRTSLISHPGWLPDGPVDLRTLSLELTEQPCAVAVDGSEPETLPVRPLRLAGERFERYTSAVKHLDPPGLFESRPSYRLLGASIPKRQLAFGLAAYFDKLDVSEALGHEMAAACMDRADGLPARADLLRGALPLRDLIGDPFDPTRRALIPAITTLTIRLRRYPSPPSFLLHRRDAAQVATAGGVYDVLPAGEFQPSSVALWDRRNDFDLWRNIVREYSEELLGTPEHDGTRTRPIAYDRWPLYQLLEAAYRDGTVASFFLGVGLDALTLAATILTVVVIDDDVFDRAFGATVRYNDEGEIVAIGGGRPSEGIPFTGEAVDRLLRSEPLASPGAACLALAWQHRDQLLGI